MSTGPEIRAGRFSTCGECGEAIVPGDKIRMSEGEACHSACVEHEIEALL